MSPWWRRVRSPVPAIPFSRMDFLVVDIETTGSTHVATTCWSSAGCR